MIRAALVLATVSGCQQARPAIAPERDDGRFVVRVVDEAGHPLAGVRVYAVRDGLLEGWGQVGSYSHRFGLGVTNLFGVARFARPRGVPGLFTAIHNEHVWAVAETSGWPAQPADDHGTIVLGPPRSVTGTIEVRAPCNDQLLVSLGSDWSYGTPDVPPARLETIPIRADGTFTFDDVGPGTYGLLVSGCGGAQVWFRGRDGIPHITLPS